MPKAKRKFTLGKMHLYGDEIIDKPGWLRWKETLLKERERRKGGDL